MGCPLDSRGYPTTDWIVKKLENHRKHIFGQPCSIKDLVKTLGRNESCLRKFIRSKFNRDDFGTPLIDRPRRGAYRLQFNRVRRIKELLKESDFRNPANADPDAFKDFLD